MKTFKHIYIIAVTIFGCSKDAPLLPADPNNNPPSPFNLISVVDNSINTDITQINFSWETGNRS